MMMQLGVMEVFPQLDAAGSSPLVNISAGGEDDERLVMILVHRHPQG